MKFLKNLLGITALEATIEGQKELIQSLQKDKDDFWGFQKCLRNQIRRNWHYRGIIRQLEKEVQAKKEEIRQVEKALEGTIDQQYSRIQQLETQLAHRTDYEGTFYVYNPLKNKPKKQYATYAAALEDAKAVSKLEAGAEVYILKMVSGVQCKEIVNDFSLLPEEEIPF